MAKDPAFLFYPGDWQGGTSSFTRAHKGAYMDLLMTQFNQGRMTIQDIQDVLGSDFELMWERKLKAKFKEDDKGLFYNERLDFEQEKRKNFSKSRRSNLKKETSDTVPHTEPRMENENINVIENKNKNEIEKEMIFLKTDFDLRFVDELFSLAFFTWLHYKKSKGQRYKNQQSLEACYENLITLSNKIPAEATLIVKQAMGNNWAGLFPLKEQFKSNQPNNSTAKKFD